MFNPDPFHFATGTKHFIKSIASLCYLIDGNLKAHNKCLGQLHVKHRKAVETRARANDMAYRKWERLHPEDKKMKRYRGWCGVSDGATTPFCALP